MGKKSHKGECVWIFDKYTRGKCQLCRFQSQAQHKCIMPNCRMTKKINHVCLGK